MEEEDLRLVEWSIENFSCWNVEIHGKVIISQNAYDSPCFAVGVFPKGKSGQGKRIAASICNDVPVTMFGELSFIGSDGSLLITQQVDSRGDAVDILELPPGPQFEDVIAQIRKNEDDHKDRLTIRLRVKNRITWKSVEYMRTTIDVFHTSLKISSCILDYLKEDRSCSFKAWICYKETPETSIVFSIEGSKLKLTLTRLTPKTNVFVLTRLIVLSNEIVVRTEENEHVFRGVSDWMFSDSLTLEEVKKDGFSSILGIKIIPSNEPSHRRDFFVFDFLPTRAVSLMPSEIVPHQPENALRDLSGGLMCLFQDQDFSDFRLKCGDVTFPVHRAILSARSPVFKTMLSTDMREAASSEVVIGDLDPSTLFLTFLYSGSVEDLQSDGALKLYYAADKYQVPSLKRECAHFLSVNVTFSNVCDILSLADKHQDEGLTGVAHDFILKNYNEVLRSQEWIRFMKSDPLLAVETVTHFAQRNRVGDISRSSQHFSL